jgi:hypothetical protein
MYCTPCKVSVPKIDAPLAIPPEKISCTAKALIIALTLLPPEMSSSPPLLNVLRMVPPDRTFNWPPLRTMTPSLVWPLETASVPLLTVVMATSLG